MALGAKIGPPFDMAAMMANERMRGNGVRQARPNNSGIGTDGRKLGTASAAHSRDDSGTASPVRRCTSLPRSRRVRAATAMGRAAGQPLRSTKAMSGIRAAEASGKMEPAITALSALTRVSIDGVAEASTVGAFSNRARTTAMSRAL